jgi:hypothetical protein
MSLYQRDLVATAVKMGITWRSSARHKYSTSPAPRGAKSDAMTTPTAQRAHLYDCPADLHVAVPSLIGVAVDPNLC